MSPRDSLVLTQVMPSTSALILNNGDSLDASDAPFSQKNQDLLKAYSLTAMDSSPDASSGPELAVQALDDELRQLRPFSALFSSSATVQIPEQAVSEDMHSGLFYDADDERWVPFGAVYDEMDATYSETNFNNKDTADRQVQDQQRGFEIWNYVSPFADVEVSLHDVDRRFIIERV